MSSYHRLSDAAFATLSHCHGDADTIHRLRDAQLSKNLLLLRYLVQASRATRDAAVAVLAEADARDPEAVRDLLVQPMIASWAARTARRIRQAPTDPAPLDADLRHLDAVAAVAALRCGVDARLTVSPRDGRLTLPTVGATTVRDPVELDIVNGRIAVTGADCWQAVRRLDRRVMLDDLDPYRNSHHIRAAQRLSDTEVSAWQRRYGAARQLLATYAPDLAEELAAGLLVLVPLVDAGDGSGRSATPRDAFGSFGLTLPGTDVDLAITLVHEFQHSKLNAVLDLVKLYEPERTPTYYAPWRPDPRPVSGLYQGVYAFTGVAVAWRRLLGAPGLEAVAERTFATSREQVHCGLSALEGSALLTDDGRRFAAGLRETVDELLAVALPAPVVSQARGALRANRAAWRERNGRAD